MIQVPAEAQATPHFDANAATNAYLAQIPANKTARSDAYFEGGYWMILWDFLYGAVVALLLLNLRWSARMRNLAERITRLPPVQAERSSAVCPRPQVLWIAATLVVR